MVLLRPLALLAVALAFFVLADDDLAEFEDLRLFVADDSFGESDLSVSVLSKADGSSADLDQACFSSSSPNNGQRLTALSGTIRVRSSPEFNEAFSCLWQIQPVLDDGRQVKFIKFRLSSGEQFSLPSCIAYAFEVSFVDKSNLKLTKNLCQTGADRWQRAESFRGINFIFSSQTGSDSLANFDFEFYTVTTSKFPLKTSDSNVECGRSSLRPLPDSQLARTRRVVGGLPASMANWPWLVSLPFEDGRFCASNIINDRWLLTVANCFKDKNDLGRWEVAIGEQSFQESFGLDADDSKTSAVLRLKIEQIFTHHGYQPSNRRSKDFDMALVKLQKAIPLKSIGASPICLPSVSLNEGQLCYIAGWGDTGGTGTSGRLHEARVPVMSNSECRLMSPFYKFYVTDRMICAGYRAGGIDSCLGDTGSPLVFYVNGRWELHGVSSFGKGCALPRAPGVYTKVASYLDWMQKVIGAFS